MSKEIQKRNRVIAVAVLTALAAFWTPLAVVIEPIKQIINAFDTPSQDDTTSEETDIK